MEYNFVAEPSADILTRMALTHQDQVDWANKAKKLNVPYLKMSKEDRGHEPLTHEEINLLQKYDQKMTEFTREHYFFKEVIADVQRINYILGHRGGDEFPGFQGSVNYEQLASEVLSQLRAGTYKRGSGATYSLDEFERNISTYYKGRLKSGWLRKA